MIKLFLGLTFCVLIFTGAIVLTGRLFQRSHPASQPNETVMTLAPDKTQGRTGATSPAPTSTVNSGREALANGLQEAYTLEWRTYYSESEALSHMGELAKKGINAYYTPLRKNSQVLFSVRTGVYPSKTAASAAKKQLGSNTGKRPKLIRF